jgi:peptidoglycan hydrolase CwlO-like protein
MKLCLAVIAGVRAVNPVSKVLDLLTSLQSKMVKEGEVEEEQYGKFVRLCQNNARQLQWELNDSADRLAQQKATIEKAASDIESDEAAISELSATIQTAESDIAKAEKLRAKQHSDYSARDADFAETISTLSRAIEDAKKASFAQFSSHAVSRLSQAFEVLVQAGSIDSSDRTRLQSLMQSSEDAQDRVVVQSHKGQDSVVDVFADMLEKAEAQRGKSTRKETEAAHSHTTMVAALKEKVRNANDELSDAKHHKAAAEETKASTEGDLAVTSKDADSDKNELASLQTDCMVKASDHQASVEERNEELKALEAAKKIIEEKTGGATNRAYSLLEVQSKTQSQDYIDVIDELKALSRRNNDFSLSLLTSQISSTVKTASSSGVDPFAKVKGLIENMIVRLVDEGKKEADAKAYCDKEMKETEEKKAEHEEDIESLSGKIKKRESSVERLTADIATLEADLAHIATMQKEMDENRAAERAEYEIQSSDYKQGIEGIQMAIKVLKDYYGKSSLLQHDPAEGESTGIIGMLEVAESDFTKLLGEVEVDEKESAKYYEETTETNKITKAEKKTAVEYKTKEQAETKSELEELSGDRESEQSELDAVLDYYSKIKKQCVAKPEPYEERKHRRESEMEGLKNALDILEGNAIGFLQMSRPRRS